MLQNLTEQLELGSIKLHQIGAEIEEITNDEKLPTIQGKLAQQIIKDTYDLSFVSLPQGYDENALEDALEKNITQFLLELGTGFAFVGRQKEIVVSGKTRKIRPKICRRNSISNNGRIILLSCNAVKAFGIDIRNLILGEENEESTF